MNQPTTAPVDIHTAYIYILDAQGHQLHYSTMRSDWSLGEIGALPRTFPNATQLKAAPKAFELLLLACKTGQSYDMTREERDAPAETRDFATFLDDMREAKGGKRTNGYVSKLAAGHYFYLNIGQPSWDRFSDLRTMDLELEYDALRADEGEEKAKQIMGRIARNRFAAVRSTIADNATCPKFLLWVLSQDHKASVARAAVKNAVKRQMWDVCEMALEYEECTTGPRGAAMVPRIVFFNPSWMRHYTATKPQEFVSLVRSLPAYDVKTMLRKAPKAIREVITQATAA